jgi:hypothetical protein
VRKGRAAACLAGTGRAFLTSLPQAEPWDQGENFAPTGKHQAQGTVEELRDQIKISCLLNFVGVGIARDWPLIGQEENAPSVVRISAL